MNPQGGEGNNDQLSTATPTPVVDRPLNADSLDKLEGVVAAAKLEAGAVQPTAPIQALEETPKGQFENQFGSGPASPPVAEVPELNPTDLKETSVAQLDPSTKAVDDLLAKGPQVVENPNPTVEAVAPAEKTPADILKEKIAANIDAFLEEVTQKQGVTS